MALEVFDSRTDIRNLFITPEIRARIMRFEPGEVSQGHTHDIGHEMFVVLDGHAEFTIEGETGVVGPGQICVARAGQWHELRTVGNEPMTLYLSVTPHIEPTHTLWDHEGGTRLPYRYGGSTQAERRARTTPEVSTADLLQDHLRAAHALAAAAQDSAAAQETASADLLKAVESADAEGVNAALDDMWRAFHALYSRLQVAERAWNELAPTAATPVRT